MSSGQGSFFERIRIVRQNSKDPQLSFGEAYCLRENDQKMKLASTAFTHAVICVNGLSRGTSSRAGTPMGKA